MASSSLVRPLHIQHVCLNTRDQLSSRNVCTVCLFTAWRRVTLVQDSVLTEQRHACCFFSCVIRRQVRGRYVGSLSTHSGRDLCFVPSKSCFVTTFSCGLFVKSPTERNATFFCIVSDQSVNRTVSSSWCLGPWDHNSLGRPTKRRVAFVQWSRPSPAKENPDDHNWPAKQWFQFACTHTMT